MQVVRNNWCRGPPAASVQEADGRLLLVEGAELEAEQAKQVTVAKGYWPAVVPCGGVWLGEALLRPRRASPRLPDLRPTEGGVLADMLPELLNRNEKLFATAIPCSIGCHGAPSATVKKHVVGMRGWPT